MHMGCAEKIASTNRAGCLSEKRVYRHVGVGIRETFVVAKQTDILKVHSNRSSGQRGTVLTTLQTHSVTRPAANTTHTWCRMHGVVKVVLNKDAHVQTGSTGWGVRGVRSFLKTISDVECSLPVVILIAHKHPPCPLSSTPRPECRHSAVVGRIITRAKRLPTTARLH